MGKFSRDKGSRGERALRDYLRSLGWEADRVPLSGASQGFKGDVRATKEGITKVFELKCRKDNFKAIYELYKNYGSAGELCFVDGITAVRVVSDFGAFTTSGSVQYFSHVTFTADKKTNARTLSKIVRMRELVKDCDYLVIKDDRKPFLFIEYK